MLTRKYPRSPKVMLGGMAHLARFIDKIRMRHAGLIQDYNYITVGFDKYLLDFLQIKGEDFEQRVLQGGTDEEILALAHGGIRDHLGGGFHRYSTDERWLVPHFEKMLYDNALLTVAYVEGFQATGNLLYRRVVEETLDYVLREMTSPEGPFYSTQDADSDGEEGKFYVWSAEEIEQVLGDERAEMFRYVYDVTPGGNWEGRNILHRLKTDEQDARLLRVEVGEMRRVLDECRRQLLAVRARRVWPGRDEKVLTSWNGLMIAAFALAGQVLERPDYITAAVKAADFILTRMRTPEGRLLRTYSAGSEPKLNAYLEDYAFLLDALTSLYESTFAIRWITEAGTVAETIVKPPNLRATWRRVPAPPAR